VRSVAGASEVWVSAMSRCTEQLVKPFLLIVDALVGVIRDVHARPVCNAPKCRRFTDGWMTDDVQTQDGFERPGEVAMGYRDRYWGHPKIIFAHRWRSHLFNN
jgi:hypothetical protein